MYHVHAIILMCICTSGLSSLVVTQIRGLHTCICKWHKRCSRCLHSLHTQLFYQVALLWAQSARCFKIYLQDVTSSAHAP